MRAKRPSLYFICALMAVVAALTIGRAVAQDKNNEPGLTEVLTDLAAKLLGYA